LRGEGVKKLEFPLFLSFRRKPESSIFKVLRTFWTPVFTGETTKKQFFHTFGEDLGGGENGIFSQLQGGKGGGYVFDEIYATFR